MATATNIQSQNRIISTVPTRIYLNENVTPVLLEGMKIIAKERYVSITNKVVLIERADPPIHYKYLANI